MADLAAYYTVHQAEMDRFIKEKIHNFGIFPEFSNKIPYTAPNFNMEYWSEISRQTRGLQLMADSFSTFWEEFQTWYSLRAYNYLKMLIAATSEYEPLHNYDRTEEQTETIDRSGNRKTTGTDNSRTSTSGNSSGNTTNSVNSTTTNSVNGYNGEAMTVRDSSTTTGSDSDTSTVKHISGATGSRSIDSTEIDKEDQSTTRKIRAYGNIGVTTSQQMLESEIDLRRKHIIMHMVADFKRDFCIMVY